MDFFKPGLTQLAGNRLRRAMRDHDDQSVDLAARGVDEVLVTSVGRVEFADDEPECHEIPVPTSGPTSLAAGSCRQLTRHARRPMMAMTRNTV
jgi:hypothetical protein